jgi:hypothetical protein
MRICVEAIFSRTLNLQKATNLDGNIGKRIRTLDQYFVRVFDQVPCDTFLKLLYIVLNVKKYCQY